ncbi:MAG: hypothetical protein FWE69_04460, partial [Clostridiales bacterium]|nr:hypothetical protein [Clostridiales bacterium]
MKTLARRFTSWLLAVILVLPSILWMLPPASAFADTSDIGDIVLFIKETGTGKPVGETVYLFKVDNGDPTKTTSMGLPKTSLAKVGGLFRWENIPADPGAGYHYELRIFTSNTLDGFTKEPGGTYVYKEISGSDITNGQVISLDGITGADLTTPYTLFTCFINYKDADSSGSLDAIKSGSSILVDITTTPNADIGPLKSAVFTVNLNDYKDYIRSVTLSGDMGDISDSAIFDRDTGDLTIFLGRTDPEDPNTISSSKKYFFTIDLVNGIIPNGLFIDSGDWAIEATYKSGNTFYTQESSKSGFQATVSAGEDWTIEKKETGPVFKGDRFTPGSTVEFTYTFTAKLDAGVLLPDRKGRLSFDGPIKISDAFSGIPVGGEPTLVAATMTQSDSSNATKTVDILGDGLVSINGTPITAATKIYNGNEISFSEIDYYYDLRNYLDGDTLYEGLSGRIYEYARTTDYTITISYPCEEYFKLEYNHNVIAPGDPAEFANFERKEIVNQATFDYKLLGEAAEQKTSAKVTTYIGEVDRKDNGTLSLSKIFTIGGASMVPSTIDFSGTNAPTFALLKQLPPVSYPGDMYDWATANGGENCAPVKITEPGPFYSFDVTGIETYVSGTAVEFEAYPGSYYLVEIRKHPDYDIIKGLSGLDYLPVTILPGRTVNAGMENAPSNLGSLMFYKYNETPSGALHKTKDGDEIGYFEIAKRSGIGFWLVSAADVGSWETDYAAVQAGTYPGGESAFKEKYRYTTNDNTGKVSFLAVPAGLYYLVEDADTLDDYPYGAYGIEDAIPVYIHNDTISGINELTKGNPEDFKDGDKVIATCATLTGEGGAVIGTESRLYNHTIMGSLRLDKEYIKIDNTPLLEDEISDSQSGAVFQVYEQATSG